MQNGSERKVKEGSTISIVNPSVAEASGIRSPCTNPIYPSTILTENGMWRTLSSRWARHTSMTRKYFIRHQGCPSWEVPSDHVILGSRALIMKSALVVARYDETHI